MVPFYSRIWGVAGVAGCVMVASSLTYFTLERFFLSLVNVHYCVMGLGLAVLGVCDLIVFRQMTPWSRPGRLFRLFRESVGSGAEPDET